MRTALANKSLTQPHTNVNPSLIDYNDNKDFLEMPQNLDSSSGKDEHDVTITDFRDDRLIYIRPRKYVSKHFNIIDAIMDPKIVDFWDRYINAQKEICETIVTLTSEIYQFNNLIKDVKKSIDDIVNIDFDWEGRGLEKPNNITVSTSKEIIVHLLIDVFQKKHINNWTEPFVYSEEGGYICIGWYQKNKTLYFNIKDKIINYRKLFDSEDGNSRKSKHDILNKNNCFSIWKWMFIDEYK